MKKLCLKKIVYLIGFAAIIIFIVTKNNGSYVKANSNIDNKQIRVAVLDNGISADCYSLYENRIEDGYSFVDGEDVLYDGHGAHMSKTILSSTNSNVSILPIKVLDENGKGTGTFISDGIYKAVEENVDIINLSLNTTSKSTVLEIAVEYAISKGIIVVTSAGNDGKNASNYSPSDIEDVVVVGSCTPLGVRQDFSNYGSTVDYNILSTSTSEATAITTGLIADYIGKGNNDYLNYLDTLSQKHELGCHSGLESVFQPEQKKSDMIENNRKGIKHWAWSTKQNLLWKIHLLLK